VGKFADVFAYFRPKLGMKNLVWRSNIDANRMTKSGKDRVGTLAACGPSDERKVSAMSFIHIQSPAAMKRSPAASGAVMARVRRSPTSRTSATQNRCVDKRASSVEHPLDNRTRPISAAYRLSATRETMRFMN
jgi:hypothetical protein